MSVAPHVIKHLIEEEKARAPDEIWGATEYEYVYTNVSESVSTS